MSWQELGKDYYEKTIPMGNPFPDRFKYVAVILTVQNAYQNSYPDSVELGYDKDNPWSGELDIKFEFKDNWDGDRS